MEEETSNWGHSSFWYFWWWLGRSDLVCATCGTWDWRWRTINSTTQANSHRKVKSTSNSFGFYNSWATKWSHSTVVTNAQASRKTLNANIQDCDNRSVLSQNPIKHYFLLSLLKWTPSYFDHFELNIRVFNPGRFHYSLVFGSSMVLKDHASYQVGMTLCKPTIPALYHYQA
jgi:hypothetical protein